jgi:enoyl-CoA hydratase/carnithine racemase
MTAAPPAPSVRGCTRALRVAGQIAREPPLSIAAMKEQLRSRAAHTLSPQGSRPAPGLRRVVNDSHDYREGIGAVKEKPRLQGRVNRRRTGGVNPLPGRSGQPPAPA